MQALAQLEDPNGLPGLDYAADTPSGPMQVTRSPLRPLDPENLPVAAPESNLGKPSTPMLQDKPAGIRDAELESATQLDADEKSQRLFETATRQMIAGLTRTPVQPTLTQPGTAVKDLQAKRAKAKENAYRELELGNQGKRLDFEQKEAARKAALDQTRRDEDVAFRERGAERADKGQEIQKETNRIMMGLRFKSDAREEDAAKAKADERGDKAASAAMPFLGGTLTLAPGLSDTERGQARTTAGMWNAADSAVENFQKTLEDFARSPSNETKGRVTAALRTASSAFNSAIGGGAMSADEARAMSEAMGADILSPTGLQALAQSVLGGDDVKAAQTISNRVRAARQANRAAALGRLKTYGTYAEGSAPQAAGTSPDEDAQAVAWAKAHKDDPRAAEILRLHGVK